MGRSALSDQLSVHADFLTLAEPGFDFGEVGPEVADSHGFHVDILCPHRGVVNDAERADGSQRKEAQSGRMEDAELDMFCPSLSDQ